MNDIKYNFEGLEIINYYDKNNGRFFKNLGYNNHSEGGICMSLKIN